MPKNGSWIFPFMKFGMIRVNLVVLGLFPVRPRSGKLTIRNFALNKLFADSAIFNHFRMKDHPQKCRNVALKIIIHCEEGYTCKYVNKWHLLSLKLNYLYKHMLRSDVTTHPLYFTMSVNCLSIVFKRCHLYLLSRVFQDRDESRHKSS